MFEGAFFEVAPMPTADFCLDFWMLFEEYFEEDMLLVFLWMTLMASALSPLFPWVVVSLWLIL